MGPTPPPRRSRPVRVRSRSGVTGRTGALFEAVQRVDGIKVFALAVLAAAACAASRHGSLLRR